MPELPTRPLRCYLCDGLCTYASSPLPRSSDAWPAGLGVARMSDWSARPCSWIYHGYGTCQAHLLARRLVAACFQRTRTTASAAGHSEVRRTRFISPRRRPASKAWFVPDALKSHLPVLQGLIPTLISKELRYDHSLHNGIRRLPFSRILSASVTCIHPGYFLKSHGMSRPM